ncbi:MAG: hypothetical protein IPJ88_00615 [Myxococcales bacterium]|nr:MAG: hypothetical protein IPJ88_00615 [Myxococcales bacterium]
MHTVLHVAALPFPSTQGTQAAIKHMLEASATQHDTHLLCYAGQAYALDKQAYKVHRLYDLPKDSSLRSGPSLKKLALDMQLVWQVRKLHAVLAPKLVLAHHIEAAWACTMAGIRPWVFIAHSSLEDELGSYFHRAFSRPLSLAGRYLDRVATFRPYHRFAVTPWLCKTLEGRHHKSFSYLPIPGRCITQQATPRNGKLGRA